MKKLFILGVSLVVFAGAKAQIDLGVKAGVNNANFRGSDAEGSKNKLGFYAGITGDVTLTQRLHLKPELVYSQQGAKQSIEGTSAKLHANYINLPVMLAYQLPNGLYAETGPQIGYLVSANVKAGGQKMSVKDEFKKTDLSWGLGLGYLSKQNIGFTVRYNLGLSKVAKGDADAKVYNGVLQVGVAYAFKARP